MPETTIELIIRARDEASRVLNQAVAQTRQAAQAGAQANQALEQSSRRLSQATSVASREIRATGISARFAAVSLVNELSPALGAGVSRLTSLASVAAFSGTALGALTVVGVGGLVIGLGALIARLREAVQAQEKWNEAIRQGSTDVIAKRIVALDQQIERERRLITETKDVTVAVEGLSETYAVAAGTEKRLAELTQERDDLLRTLTATLKGATDQQQVQQFVTDQQTEAFKKNAEAVKRAAEEAASWAKAQGELLARQTALRELEPFLLEEIANTLALTEARRTLDEASRQAARERAASLENLERQAESIAEGQAQGVIDEVDRLREPLQRLMTTLGNLMADTLFDALIGRSRNLEQALRSAFEHAARNVFRDTVVPLFGGKSSGFGLQDLLRL